MGHPLLRSHLEDSDFRLLSFRVDDDGRKSSGEYLPDRFFATIWDYTNGRTLEVTGALAALVEASPGSVEIRNVVTSPLPSEEEFEAAVGTIRRDRTLRAALANGELRAYRPMPPTIDVDLPDGRTDRTVAVGLLSTADRSHQIVGVNMFAGRILEELDLPAGPGECEPPPSAEGCPSTGTNGQATVTVTQGSQVVWRFVVVRPAASSGTNGSGIELRYVDYRGKRVLYRAHVPILNVEYLQSGVDIGCGPTYRDWQNSEACFQATGTDPVPGLRMCSAPAQTLLDAGTDAGNFRGVAIYVHGQEVVLVSELQAGWYRYISEWRLHSNGTIRPRFGFAAIDNPCTCHEHVHHAYWRFDFDIRTFWNNVVEEFNDPPLIGSSNWHTKAYEIRRLRDSARKRRWRVKNASTGEGYELRPGAGDGTSDPYGIGDMWVLKYKSTEIDDGQGFTTNPTLSMAHIDSFRSPAESVAPADVVLWYAGHFKHDVAHAGGERVGPDLLPVGW